MTVAEWLTSDDPEAMLGLVRRQESGRKLRLFACACCRRVAYLFEDQRAAAALEAAERYADAAIDRLALLNAYCEVACDCFAPLEPGTERENARWYAHWASEFCVMDDAAHCTGAAAEARSAVTWAAAVEYWDGFGENHRAIEERQYQADLLRCIFGNPFRPVAVEPEWRTSTVVALAAGIYEERAFDRLPVLADALEDAGCTDANLLGHCRGPGPHARGCWVVDLILGRS